MAEQTEEVKVLCPVCEHEVGTKENGTKIKAHKISGEKCDGSDELVADAEPTTDGLDKGDAFDALEGSQDDDMSPNDETDPSDETPPEASAQSSEDGTSPTGGKFVHVIKVTNPCPYLGDQAWHAENAKMAEKVAQQAGHVLAGGEAKNTETEDAGQFTLVHYSVPVK